MGNSPPFVIHSASNGSRVFTVYINLQHRTDRNQQIQQEFARMGITEYKRLHAIQKPHGSLGCSLSHIAALKQGIASGADHLVIFEDDFEFLISPEEYKHVLHLLTTINYDVLLLSPLPAKGHVKPTTYPFFHRITKSSNTGGFIVNKLYAATLLKNFVLGANLLQVYPVSHFCIDVFKNMLEKRDNWFVYHQAVGKQREGYSDIEQRVRNND